MRTAFESEMKPPGGSELKRNISPLAFLHFPIISSERAQALACGPLRGTQERQKLLTHHCSVSKLILDSIDGMTWSRAAIKM